MGASDFWDFRLLVWDIQNTEVITPIIHGKIKAEKIKNQQLFLYP